MSGASLMGAAHIRGRCHGTPPLGCDGFTFPHPSFRIHAPFPSDLHTHSSFRFHPKLRSDSTLPSALTNDSVTLSAGHFQRVRPAWSWTQGCPLRAGPWPELARGSQHSHLPQPAPCFVPPQMELIPGGKHLAKAVWGGGPQRSQPKGLQLGPFSDTKAQTPTHHVHITHSYNMRASYYVRYTQ